jgi:hypothetical protein
VDGGGVGCDAWEDGRGGEEGDGGGGGVDFAMKQIIPIAIIVLFGLSFQSFDRPFHLKPKVGIDELRFGIATVKDVKRSYSRSLRFSKGSGLIISEPGCVSRTYESLRSKEHGVNFRFAGTNGTLSSVEVTSVGARLGETLVIGSSRKQDVVKAYNVSDEVVDEYVELYLYVDEAWAEFEFNDSLVLRKVVLHAGSYR